MNLSATRKYNKMPQHKKSTALSDGKAAVRSVCRKRSKHAALVQGMNEILTLVPTSTATKAGEIAPVFRFRDNVGKWVAPHRLRHQRPLVIVFHRGNWCEYCAAGLAAIEKAVPELCAVATVLIISPQAPEQDPSGQLLRLSDPGNEVAAKFGLRYEVPSHLVALYQDLGIDVPGFAENESRTLPMSALYVVSCEGLVLYSEVHADYMSQPKPDNALLVLRANRYRTLTTTWP